MSNTLQNLNKEQKLAVTTTEGPLLIIAGAGTGKTTVITRRIAYLIGKKLAKPAEILALTFTDKAANEMEERVDILVPYGFIDTWISTFHSFGAKILRDHALDLGIPTDFKVLTKPQQVLFFQQNLFDLPLDYYRPLGNPTKFIQALVTFISRCKDEEITPADYQKYVEKLKLKTKNLKLKTEKKETKQEIKKQEELAKTFQKYEELKTQAGFLDFGDLIILTLALFRKFPKILRSYQEKFKYILVDEFQDTNWAQLELLKLLAPPQKNICVVADDDQCLPPGTLVDTPNGKKEIEKFKPGDELLTAVGRGHLGISKVNRVFKTTKSARFLTFTTQSGKKVTVTDNHLMFCYVPVKKRTNTFHYVYLMNRKNLGWRIGVTDDLAVRLKLERSADGILGLRAFKKDEEARYHEMLWALKYAIPPVVFKEREQIAIRGKLLNNLYRVFDTQKNAEKLSKDLGVDLHTFHYYLDGVTRGSARRIKINLYLCSRNHKSKNKGILKNPLISHSVSIQTSNKTVIAKLKSFKIPMHEAKKGILVRYQNVDIKKVNQFAKKLYQITEGFIEYKFTVGKLNQVSLPALIMKAKNVLPGHCLPVRRGNHVFYELITGVSEEWKGEQVYDLEIAKTHNFIANDIVVHNSIYRWRGAATYNIHEFQKTYPKAKTINLTTNYRSTQSILNTAYRLIQHNNPNRLEFQNKIPKKLRSVKKDFGTPPVEINAPTLTEQAEKVAEEIKKLVNNKQLTTDSRNKKNIKNYQFRDIAILARTNSGAEYFLKALQATQIAAKFVGAAGFYNLSEIANLISFIKSITTFDDSSSLFHLATSEIYNFPLKSAIKLTDFAKRKNLNLKTVLEKIDNLETQLEFSREAKSLAEKINSDLDDCIEQSRKRNVGQVLYSFLEKTKYLERLQNEGSAEAVAKISNIGKFFEKITEFLRSTTNQTPLQFLEYLQNIKGTEDPLLTELDPDLDAVAVMTIHSAKGLEFPVVFMVDLVSERFPSRERSEPIEVPQDLVKERIPTGDYHLEEERRLFYVGATRAADQLFLCWSPDVGGKRLQKPSPFVLEALDRPFIKPFTKVGKPMEKITQFAQLPQIQIIPNLSEELVLKLSAGAVEDFLTCEYKYRYVHILRIPILRHHAVVYGAALHDAVASFWRAKQNGKTLTLPQLLETFENAWISEGFLTAVHEEKRLAQGKLVLKNFWKREKDSRVLPTYIEKEFQFKANGVVVRGRWDRVDIKNDRVSILDYKSSENVDQKKADFDTKNSIQLAIYALAYREIYKKFPDNLSLYFLETGVVGNYKPTNDDLAKTHQKILEVATKIRQKIPEDSFLANPVYFGREPACVYCAYNAICPFSLVKA